MVTTIKMEGNNQYKMSAFGAFNDDQKQQKRIVSIFTVDENSVYVVGENGLIRKWALS
jgi:hypothetical protein